MIFFMIIPIISLIGFLFSLQRKSIKFAKNESIGVEFLINIKNIYLNIQQHRDTVKLYLSEKMKQDNQVKSLQIAIDKEFQELEGIDASHEFLTSTNDTLNKLQRNWEEIKRTWQSAGPLTNYDKHVRLGRQTIELMRYVSNQSNLRLDPELATSRLLDSLIDTLPGIIGIIDNLRGLGTDIVTRQIITLEEEGRLNNFMIQLEGQLEDLYTTMQVVMEIQSALRSRLEPLVVSARDSADSFLDTVRDDLIDDESLTINPGEYLNAGTETLTKFVKFYDAAAKSVQTLLQDRVKKATTGRNLQLLIALMLIAVASLVAVITYRYITSQIGAIIHVFDDIDKGDYEARAKVFSTDELGTMAASLNEMLDRNLFLIQSQDERDAIQNSIMKLLDEVSDVAGGDLTVEAEVTEDVTGAIADSFNHMINQLRQIVTNVQNATLQVSSSANQIQATAEHLADGSSLQAEQIVDSSAALDEMAVSIQQVSENSSLSATVADQALANAKQGTVAVQNTIQGMHRIRTQVQETAKRIKRLGERSQEIGEIVQLIGDIADRTSILALNASIQAARAGEAGRSFAVVAEEVERLAERATDATKQIASLVNTIQSETNEAVTAMEESTHEVVQGSQVADRAGQALGEIESVSSRLAELIQSISLAATQQARGSDNLSKAMAEISEVTQQTATGTKQAAGSISSLATLADELRDSVSTFKLSINTSG